MPEDFKQYTLGEIYIFKFSEFNPDDFVKKHPHRPDDLFVVYAGTHNGNPILCKWGDGAFWFNPTDTPEGWRVVQNVEMWFRIPKAKEIVNDSEQQEEKV